MRYVFTPLRREPGADQCLIYLAGERGETGRFLHTDPDRPRPAPAGELPGTVQAHVEVLTRNGIERASDILRHRLRHLADEAQRDMQVLRLDPARAVDAAAQRRKPGAQLIGQGQGSKQADHGRGLSSILRDEPSALLRMRKQSMTLIMRSRVNGVSKDVVVSGYPISVSTPV